MVTWNVLHSIATIVKAMADMGIKFENAEREVREENSP